MTIIGYASTRYAESLAEIGTPKLLSHSEGWILERVTPKRPYVDAIGCYPIFTCKNWENLHLDMNELGSDLVSIAMVPDPFGDYDEAYLHECFKNRVMPFKQHFIVDMHRPIHDIVSKHHQKYARKAQKHITTEVCLEPETFLDEWLGLHQKLVDRHEISGIQAYSKHAFEMQLSTPGLVVLRAQHNNETVGAQLWFIHNNVAYGHVLAFNENGYKLGATYALYWYALNYFKDKVRWCDIGGVAGMQDDDSSDLSIFKEGWSTGRKTAYLCGRILNQEKYTELVKLNKHSGQFFPAYRHKL